jgi:hypothetical protein
MLEWQRDWTAKGIDDAVMDIVKNHCGAYPIARRAGHEISEYAVPAAAEHA